MNMIVTACPALGDLIGDRQGPVGATVRVGADKDIMRRWLVVTKGILLVLGRLHGPLHQAQDSPGKAESLYSWPHIQAASRKRHQVVWGIHR